LIFVFISILIFVFKKYPKTINHFVASSKFIQFELKLVHIKKAVLMNNSLLGKK